MAISHVCLSCGLDLARVRARIDPHYALPIVVCPDCGWAAVRRKPRRWRSFRGLVMSLLTLSVQLGLLATGLGGLVAISIEVGDVLAQRSFDILPRDEIILRLAACATFATILGTWLTVGFGHARRTTTWLVFYGSGIVLIAFGSLVDGRWLPFRFLVATVVMTVAMAGVPLGILTRAAWRQVERSLWRARRRRLRRWSTAQ